MVTFLAVHYIGAMDGGGRGEATYQERPGRLDAGRLGSLLTAVCRNASSAVFVQDENRHCIYMNPAAERLIGFSFDEVRDLPLHDLVHHSRPDGTAYPIEECPIDRALPSNSQRRGEEAFVRKDGSFYEVEYSATPLREEGELIGTMIEVNDISERKLRERGDRFLMEFSEALQPLEDPDTAIATAARMLGEYLRADRCVYAEVEPDEDHFTVTGDYVRGETPHLSGRFSVSSFGETALGKLRQNQPFVVDDATTDERVSAEELANYEDVHARSLVCIPLHKSGRFVAAMAVHQRTPRGWEEREVELVAAVTNRCWEAIERVRVTRDLRESEKRLRQTLNINTVGVIFWSREGRLLDANEAFLRMSGRTLTEAVGLSWRELTPPEFIPASERAWWEVNNEPEMTPYEKRYYRTDGSTWWGLFAARKLNDTETVEFVLDISERKGAEEEVHRLNSQLERRVAERTAELEEANRELEAFSYSVSHDLRAPLRGVDGFSQALFEDYHDELDTNAQRYLERIRAGAKRMGNLIDDMLAFSRTSRMNLNRTTVDLSEIASAAGRELERQQPERTVEFEVQPGLSANGDSKQLRIVLDNLLGNAWKFTRGRDPAVIEFGLHENGEEAAYFVKDNGSGFSMKYADKLFVPFQRLHGREFEGSGVGLATVQRVIHKHGGRVWATSEPEQGATFYFTLPSD